jgi:hypothetical protein
MAPLVVYLSSLLNGRLLLLGLVIATLNKFLIKILLCVALFAIPSHVSPYTSSRTGLNILVPLEYVPQSCRATLL